MGCILFCFLGLLLLHLNEYYVNQQHHCFFLVSLYVCQTMTMLIAMSLTELYFNKMHTNTVRQGMVCCAPV